MKNKKKLVLGIGNMDRQDDGVAWHILFELAKNLGHQLPVLPGDQFENNENSPIDLLFYLHLTPEMSELLVEYEEVCFVDAHTGNVPDDFNVCKLQAEYKSSPFTHHLTADSLLYFCQTIYNHVPKSELISVRGYLFDFEQTLSPETNKLAEQAVNYILKWIKSS